MGKKIPDEDTVELEREDEDEDEDETLSLSDLPLIHKKEETNKGKENQSQEDFDFCSVSKQPEMCAADEVFFQGQILPLRHSVSSERGSVLSSQPSMMSRSESMDRFHSGTGGLISSRSSSISSSHQSSSSSSSSRPKLPPARNHFHSHPSPSPKIHFPSNNHNNNNHNNNIRNYKKTSVWNVFRLGVLTPPPEIAFQDLKPRSIDSKRKKANRSLLGGCTCSADAVDTVVVLNRSASESELDALGRVNNVEASPIMKKRAAKKHLSHHRTFEWLKQLSLEHAN